MPEEWTVGRGIAVAGKWIAIMGIVITVFAFLQFFMKFQAGYYDTPEIREFERQVVVDPCTTVTPEYRDVCCERQAGPGFYWEDNECVFGG